MISLLIHWPVMIHISFIMVAYQNPCLPDPLLRYQQLHRTHLHLHQNTQQNPQHRLNQQKLLGLISSGYHHLPPVLPPNRTKTAMGNFNDQRVPTTHRSLLQLHLGLKFRRLSPIIDRLRLKRQQRSHLRSRLSNLIIDPRKAHLRHTSLITEHQARILDDQRVTMTRQMDMEVGVVHRVVLLILNHIHGRRLQPKHLGLDLHRRRASMDHKHLIMEGLLGNRIQIRIRGHSIHPILRHRHLASPPRAFRIFRAHIKTILVVDPSQMTISQRSHRVLQQWHRGLWG